MKLLNAALCIFAIGCVSVEEKEICGVGSALENAIPVSLAIADYPWGRAEEMREAALAACKMWEEQGIACRLSESFETADIYIDYYSDWQCQDMGFVGSFSGFYDGKIGVWINSAMACRPPDWKPWFTHLVAHEIGHLFGVEDVPNFCGIAVMNAGIERNRPVGLRAALTETDVKAFAERYRHSPILDYGSAVLDCAGSPAEPQEPPVPAEECGQEIAAPQTIIKVWMDDNLLPWGSEIMASCAWWLPVNASCVYADSSGAAEVFIRKMEIGRCGLAGFTFRDYEVLDGRYAVEINTDCMPEDALSAAAWLENTAAHELAHTQGVEHIPFFCGPAVMNPFLTKRTCVSPADILAWRERSPR